MAGRAGLVRVAGLGRGAAGLTRAIGAGADERAHEAAAARIREVGRAVDHAGVADVRKWLTRLRGVAPEERLAVARIITRLSDGAR